MWRMISAVLLEGQLLHLGIYSPRENFKWLPLRQTNGWECLKTLKLEGLTTASGEVQPEEN